MATKNGSLDLNEGTAIRIPLANLISLLAATAVASYAYFGLIERVTFLEHDMDLQQVDVEANSEFRIKWPRGELGSPPADSEQFMLIEHIAMQVEKIQERMEDMMNNGVNITRLQEDVKSLREDVEKLKDGQREIKVNGNTH